METAAALSLHLRTLCIVRALGFGGGGWFQCPARSKLRIELDVDIDAFFVVLESPKDVLVPPLCALVSCLRGVGSFGCALTCRAGGAKTVR